MVTQHLVIEHEDVQAAIKEGLKRLGKDKSDTTIEILRESREGLFDHEKQLAQVRLTAEGVDLKQYLQFLLNRSFRYLGLDEAEVDIEIEEDYYRATIDSSQDLSPLIGEEGCTLNSLQHLFELILQGHSNEPLEVILEAGEFRRQRREELEQLAETLTEKALDDEVEVELDPMIPLERRIVHRVVDDYPDAKSHSIGEGRNRRVVILPRGQS